MATGKMAATSFLPHLDISPKSTLSGTCLAIPMRSPSSSKSVCVASSSSSDPKRPNVEVGKFAAALALAVVVGSAPLIAPRDAMADVAGLTKCKESKAFAKREKQEVKKLSNRLKLYAPESAPALAINASIEKTHRRFTMYGNSGLLCGADGLPHLIVDGDPAHWNEFVYPGLGFLYIAGYIGWVGRSYLRAIKSSKKPTMKEIIIDVPLALSLCGKGFTWPFAAVSEYRNGKLIVDAANITVSPR